jgi:hypothetical protein
VDSAKNGTFGTALTLKDTALTPFGTSQQFRRPREFRGETTCVARFGTKWHGFAKQAAQPEALNAGPSRSNGKGAGRKMMAEK